MLKAYMGGGLIMFAMLPLALNASPADNHAIGSNLVVIGQEGNSQAGGENTRSYSADEIAQVDWTGQNITAIALAGYETVIITQGDVISVTVEGNEQPRQRVQFTIADENLRIGYPQGYWGATGARKARL